MHKGEANNAARLGAPRSPYNSSAAIARFSWASLLNWRPMYLQCGGWPEAQGRTGSWAGMAAMQDRANGGGNSLPQHQLAVLSHRQRGAASLQRMESGTTQMCVTLGCSPNTSGGRGGCKVLPLRRRCTTGGTTHGPRASAGLLAFPSVGGWRLARETPNAAANARLSFGRHLV